MLSLWLDSRQSWTATGVHSIACVHAGNLFKSVLMSDFHALTYLKCLQYLVNDQRYIMSLVLCGIMNTRTLLNNAIHESLKFSEVAYFFPE